MTGYKIIFLILLTAIFACGPKKGGKNDLPTNPGSSALLKRFASVKVPYIVKDTLIDKDDNPKDAIDWKAFTAEVSDTIFKSEFGDVKPKLYPIGKNYNEDDAENYVFLKAVDGDKKVGYILCFDGMEIFKDAMPVVYADYDNKTKFYATLTKNYAIDQIKEMFDNKNETLIYRITYIYNNAGFFQTVLTTDNDDNTGEILYSPIDTLPKTNKFCGDYGDATNLISIRNGRSATEYMVFVHTTAGELKGYANMKPGDTIRYSKAGDMCQLDIACTAKTAALSENVACRNHTKSNTEFKGKYDLIVPKVEKPKPSIDELKKLLKPTNIVKPKEYVPGPPDTTTRKTAPVQKVRTVKKDSLGNIIEEPKVIEQPPIKFDKPEEPAKEVKKDTSKSGGG